MTQYMDPYELIDHDAVTDLDTDTSCGVDWDLGEACSLVPEECESCQ